jgi:hypothetical protein
MCRNSDTAAGFTDCSNVTSPLAPSVNDRVPSMAWKQFAVDAGLSSGTASAQQSPHQRSASADLAFTGLGLRALGFISESSEGSDDGNSCADIQPTLQSLSDGHKPSNVGPSPLESVHKAWTGAKPTGPGACINAFWPATGFAAAKPDASSQQPSTGSANSRRDDSARQLTSAVFSIMKHAPKPPPPPLPPSAPLQPLASPNPAAAMPKKPTDNQQTVTMPGFETALHAIQEYVTGTQGWPPVTGAPTLEKRLAAVNAPGTWVLPKAQGASSHSAYPAVQASAQVRSLMAATETGGGRMLRLALKEGSQSASQITQKRAHRAGKGRQERKRWCVLPGTQAVQA